MSKESEQVRSLRDIFNRAKTAARDEDGHIEDIYLSASLRSALVAVGDNLLHELKDEVYPYLNDVLWEFREEAVRVLGSCNGLKLPEFRDLAYKIWLNDENSDVKAAALDAWAGYYSGTKDPFVLKILYNIFISEKYTVWIRVKALYGFMKVVDQFLPARERSDILDLNDLEDNKLVTKAIDWNKVKRIMKQYIPGWKK